MAYSGTWPQPFIAIHCGVLGPTKCSSRIVQDLYGIAPGEGVMHILELLHPTVPLSQATGGCFPVVPMPWQHPMVRSYTNEHGPDSGSIQRALSGRTQT